MVKPLRMDFAFWTNSDYLEEIPIHYNGVPIDLTGVSVKMPLRRYPSDATLVKQFDTVGTDVEGIRMLPGIGMRLFVPKATIKTIYDAAMVTRPPDAVISFSHNMIFTQPGLVETWVFGSVNIYPGVQPQ